MTPNAWVDLVYSALVGGAVGLFFREYDAGAEVEQRLDESVGRFAERRGEALIEWRGRERRHVPRPRQAT